MGKSGFVRWTVALALVTMLCTGAVFAAFQADNVAVLKAAGVTCGSCASKIREALEKQKGVTAAEVDIETGKVVVWYDGKAAKPETLAAAVTAIGYDSTILKSYSAEEYRRATGKSTPPGKAKVGCACCDKDKKN
jgi:periplasmic mercuric ion binding protein